MSSPPQGLIICGTGHRPSKLGGYGEDVFWDLVRLCHWALDTLKPKLVITGGAIGFDQALAQAALDKGIPYKMYLPFEGQESTWPLQGQVRYNQLVLASAEARYICSPGFENWKMQARNEAMVNDSGYVLCLWDGSSGGTGNCVRYAKQKNKPMGNLWDRWQRRDF
jgi:uncharacterized phage-like protein YoqJ